MTALYGRSSYRSTVILCEEPKAGGNGYGLAVILTSRKKKVLSIAQAEQNKKVAIGGKASSGACPRFNG
jgi:hypothetical protein